MPVPARVAISMAGPWIERALCGGLSAVVVFENGDRLKPIIVGFLEAPQLPAVAAPEPTVAPADEGITEATPVPPCVEADVDGKRVRVTAQSSRLKPLAKLCHVGPLRVRRPLVRKLDAMSAWCQSRRLDDIRHIYGSA